MKQWGWRVVLGTTFLVGASLLDGAVASAQPTDTDSLTCVNVTTDRRFAKAPQPLLLTPEQSEFMTSRGCKVIGGTRIARADALCYPTAVDEQGGGDGDVGSGVDLSGQVFLCYDVKCQREEMNVGNVRTELEIEDQFGDGTIFVNERPTTKRLCVPAFIGTGPSPTPGTSATPRPSGTPGATGTPSPTSTPNGTPTSGATATPAPTGSPGSASLAFVAPIASLLQ